MFYSIDIYDTRFMRWINWTETNSLAIATDEWESMTERGKMCRVREVRDLTSGKEWIG